jgi:hypothetical protein
MVAVFAAVWRLAVPLVDERREALACRGDDVHEALALR